VQRAQDEHQAAEGGVAADGLEPVVVDVEQHLRGRAGGAVMMVMMMVAML
jgi:hypothetical protein